VGGAADGEPPMVVPAAKHFTVRVPFEQQDLEAANRSMLCHPSQLSEDTMQRAAAAATSAWRGHVSLSPASATTAATDVFVRSSNEPR
jgi:hypothetical protein